MAEETRDEPTQKTQPKTDAEPVEIPVPTREQFLADLRKVAQPTKPRKQDD